MNVYRPHPGRAEYAGRSASFWQTAARGGGVGYGAGNYGSVKPHGLMSFIFVGRACLCDDDTGYRTVWSLGEYEERDLDPRDWGHLEQQPASAFTSQQAHQQLIICFNTLWSSFRPFMFVLR